MSHYQKNQRKSSLKKIDAQKWTAMISFLFHNNNNIEKETEERSLNENQHLNKYYWEKHKAKTEI